MILAGQIAVPLKRCRSCGELSTSSWCSNRCYLAENPEDRDDRSDDREAEDEES